MDISFKSKGHLEIDLGNRRVIRFFDVGIEIVEVVSSSGVQDYGFAGHNRDAQNIKRLFK